jgi:hypothetical protein
MVSTSRVDPLVTLLRPSKWDFEAFADFSHLDFWRQIDGNEAQAAGVDLFDADALPHDCPGVRCDGTHFESDFGAFGCHSSAELWDPYVRSFAQGLETWSEKHSSFDVCDPAVTWQRYDACLSSAPTPVLEAMPPPPPPLPASKHVSNDVSNVKNVSKVSNVKNVSKNRG